MRQKEEEQRRRALAMAALEEKRLREKDLMEKRLRSIPNTKLPKYETNQAESIRPQRWGDDGAPEIDSDQDEDSKEVMNNFMPVEEMDNFMPVDEIMPDDLLERDEVESSKEDV